MEATPPRPGLVARLSGYVAGGLRYWEPRRLIYNGALAVVVLIHFFANWPASRATLTLDNCLGIFLLAVLANVAYCAAYAVDLFVQFSGLGQAKTWGRPLVLTVGTLFAATITHFFASTFFVPGQVP